MHLYCFIIYVNMRCLINSVSQIEGCGREIGTFVNFQFVSNFLFFMEINLTSSIYLLQTLEQHSEKK